MSLTQMQEKRARLLADARERLNQINDNTDESRAKELEDQHDKAIAELDKLDAQIDREQRMKSLETRQEEIERRKREENRPGMTGDGKGSDDGGEVTYRTAFYEMLRAGGEVSALDPKMRAVLRQGIQTDAEYRIQTAGTTTAGGFTVPTELLNLLVKSMAAWGPMYSENVGTVITTSGGNPLDMPTVNDTTVTAEAKAEGTALTDDGGKDVTFGKKTLNAYVFDTEFVKFSMELAQDSIFNMETLLADLLGERLGRIANLQLTTGTGSSAPNGVVTASTLGKTAAATAAVTGDEIIDLLHSVDPAYRTSPKTRFMFNDATLAAIRKLKDGEGNYLWQMGNIQQGVPGTLLGYQYEINQAVASLGAAAKVMLFGDFGKYYVRKVGAPMIGVLRERFWPDLGIAGLIRFDGELSDTAAVKHLITAAS